MESRKRKREILKNHFVLNKYPNKQDLVNLKNITGIAENKISEWFAKQRFLSKKNFTNSHFKGKTFLLL